MMWLCVNVCVVGVWYVCVCDVVLCVWCAGEEVWCVRCGVWGMVWDVCLVWCL